MDYIFKGDINYFGIVFGIITVFIMGLWYPLVIKGEYYLGKWKCVAIFAAVALASFYVSIHTQNLFYSALWGFWGFDAVWGIVEVMEQEARVAKGMYPRNPKRGNL